MTPLRRDLLVVFALALLGLALAWQVPGPLAVDIGPPDEIYLTNFEGPETNPTRDYRWATTESDLHFPGLGVSDWQVTLVAAAGARPSGPVPLTIRVAGTPVLTVPAADPDFHTYTFTVPARLLPSGDLQLDLDIPAYRPRGENRDLSLAVDRVTLESSSPRLPAPLAWGWLAGALALLYATVRLAWPLRPAGAITGVAGLILGGLLLANRLLATPYASYLALFAALAYAGVYTLRATVRRYAPILSAAASDPIAPPAGAASSAVMPVAESGVAPAGAASSAATPVPPPDAGAARRTTTPDPIQNSPGDGLVLALVLALLVGYALANFTAGIVFLARKPLPDDFVVFYRAAGRILDHQPLYQVADLRTDPLGPWYKYPPLFAWLLTPLARLPLRTALEVWNGLNVAWVGVTLAVVARAHGRRWAAAAPALLGLIVLAGVYQPLMDTLIYGQMDVALLGLLALTYLALRAGRPAWAGVPLALAIGLKVYPAVLLGYLLWRREWRALASCAGAGAALLVASLPFTGLAPWRDFVTGVLPVGNGATAWVENINFGGFLARLLIDRFDLVPFPADLGWRSTLVQVGPLVWAAALVAVAWWAMRRPAARHTPAYALGFALTTALSFMILPNAWYHYLTLLLLPLGIALFVLEDAGGAWWATARRPLLVALVLLGGAAVALAVGSFPLVWPGLNLGGPWKLILSYKFYATVALFAALVWLLRHASRSSES